MVRDIVLNIRYTIDVGQKVSLRIWKIIVNMVISRKFIENGEAY